MSPFGEPIGEDESYTMRKALREATSLLSDQFGDADQDAAVALATFLYHAHERDEFMRRAHGDAFDDDTMPSPIR